MLQFYEIVKEACSYMNSFLTLSGILTVVAIWSLSTILCILVIICCKNNIENDHAQEEFLALYHQKNKKEDENGKAKSN